MDTRPSQDACSFACAEAMGDLKNAYEEADRDAKALREAGYKLCEEIGKLADQLGWPDPGYRVLELVVEFKELVRKQGR